MHACQSLPEHCLTLRMFRYLYKKKNSLFHFAVRSVFFFHKLTKVCVCSSGPKLLTNECLTTDSLTERSL